MADGDSREGGCYRARRAQDTPVERPKREVKVGMDTAQVEEVKVLLGDDAESTETSERMGRPSTRRPPPCTAFFAFSEAG